MPRKVLIAGATSTIAREVARRLAREGDRLFLVARDARRLGTVADDLALRGAERVGSLVADLNQLERHAEIVERAAATLDGLDTVIVAHGLLGDARRAERDFTEADLVLRTNLTGVVSLLTPVTARFESARAGTIVGLSSVAGDRGRKSNYVYGAAKGALTLFLQGLRNRLHPAGVRVLTVKLGRIDTPMTASLERGRLMAAPAVAARGIVRALGGRRDVVYVPWYWRPIMAVVRALPESVFKRLNL
jgi:short-subunit dehydrogenase